MTVTDDEHGPRQTVGAGAARPTRRAHVAGRRRRPASSRARSPRRATATRRGSSPASCSCSLSALGGVLLFTSSDDRADVLVAAADLQPGRAGRARRPADRQVAADDGVASMAAADAAEIIGRFPIGRIPAGTMLTPGDVRRRRPARRRRDGARRRARPRRGAAVRSRGRRRPSSCCRSRPPIRPDRRSTSAAASTLGTGTVWAVEPIATGQLWVSVRVPRDVGLAASLASAAGHACASS